jgi:hypothetical protein
VSVCEGGGEAKRVLPRGLLIDRLGFQLESLFTELEACQAKALSEEQKELVRVLLEGAADAHPKKVGCTVRSSQG